MIANPTAFNPVYHPDAATDRRNLVLQDMLAQGYITQPPVPVRAQPQGAARPSLIEQPQEPAAAPYFTSWLTPADPQGVGSARRPRSPSSAPTTAA